MAVEGLTRDQAAEILRDAVPGAEVVGVEKMVGGQVTGAYEVLCADPSQNPVVKISAPNGGAWLAKEVGVYRLLRRHGVTKLPKLLGGAGADSAIGRPYLVMSKLPGVALERLSPELSDADLRSVYRQMGELVAQFHAIEQDAYGFRSTEILDPRQTNEAQMTSTHARASGACLDVTGDRELYEAARAYVVARTDLFELGTGPVLVHNDFHEGNIIAEQTPDGPVITGVIDMENTMAGDPMVDLAKTDCYSIKGNRIKLEGLFEGYGEVPVEWKRRTRLYQVVHLFELWGFYHEIGAREEPVAIAEDIRALIAAG